MARLTTVWDTPKLAFHANVVSELLVTEETPASTHSQMPCMLLHDKFEDIDEWEDYLSLMMDSNLLETCSIYNLRGRVLATSDEKFELLEEEFKYILEAFNRPNDPTFKQIDIASQRYCTVLNDGKHGILLKGGVRYTTLCKTGRILVLGLHKVNTNTEDTSAVIMNLGDFLITKGM